jgi:RNA polymerase sigma-70 factor (ECF subfamily)
MDSASFHKLVLTEVESVHRLAYHLCRDQHEAEDLVQETYLRALKSSDTYQPGACGVRPWLYKILHNVLYRRRTRDRGIRETLKRRLQQNSGEGSSAGGSYASNENGAALRDMNWDGLDQRLCQAIRLLPVAHRTVFLLSALEDLKYREIAEVVGVPVGTVMSRLSRARTALAAQLDDLAAEQNLRAARPRVKREASARSNAE